MRNNSTFTVHPSPFMLILGVESSCDETGLALYDTERGLLAHALHSQVEMHAEYGGVVPELASRDHIRRVLPLTERVLKEANKTLNDIDAIAYTQGPGLSGALLVGTSFAESLAFSLQIPTICVHHLEGHLLAPLLLICLVIFIPKFVCFFFPSICIGFTFCTKMFCSFR